MSMTQESINDRTSSVNTCPSTLSELRRRIAYRLCDNSQHFKCCLNRAEKSRKEGKEYLNIDPERAFVAFARAGYLLLVKLPMHPHYRLLLSDEQRRNMLHVRYSNPLYFSPPDKTFKHGQDILRTLIVLKRGITDRQIEWATTDVYPESLLICSLASLSRPAAGITPPFRDVFREKTDYRAEFEQLLGGKVESTAPKLRLRNISLPRTSESPVPSSAGRQIETRTQSDENGPKMDGIKFKAPKRLMSHLPR
jgi:hypothetical protein